MVLTVEYFYVSFVLHVCQLVKTLSLDFLRIGVVKNSAGVISVYEYLQNQIRPNNRFFERRALSFSYHPGGVLKGRCSVNKILFTEHLPFKTPPG